MVEQSMAILLLLLLVGAPDKVAACVDNVPAANEWMQSETLGSLQVYRGDGLLAVMPNYTFSCEGVVKQWIVQWDLAVVELSDSCEVVFDFHVLRPTGSCSVTSIGKNRMVVETGVVTEDTTFISTFNVSDSERIGVREGDMVGLAVTYNRTYENSCFFGRLTIAEQNDTYSPLTNEVHYIQESFDPDSITEFELECSRQHRDDDDDDESTNYKIMKNRPYDRDNDDEFSRTTRRYTRSYDRDNDDEFTRTHTHTYDDGENFESTDFLVSYTTPLINAVVESIEVQPTTSLDTKSTAFSETELTTTPPKPPPTQSTTQPPPTQSTTQLPPTQTNISTTEISGTSPEIITDPDTQDGEQESESNMIIPISVVVATIGGLLIATTGITTIDGVCYCFRERKKTGDQPDCAISENKAYSLQPSPAYEYYDNIKCVNPIYENDDDKYIYMSPEKGIAVDQKKPLSPPQQYSMEHNAAYGTSSLPNTYTTTATAATIVKELSRSFRSQKPTASVGKYVGNCFIVEDSVYEIPQ